MGTSFRSAPWPDVCFFSSLQLEQKRLSERKSKPNVSQTGQGSIFWEHSCFVQQVSLAPYCPILGQRLFYMLHLSWTCYPEKHSVYNKWNNSWAVIKNETFCFSLSLLRLDMRFGNQNNGLKMLWSFLSCTFSSPLAMMEASNSRLPFPRKKNLLHLNCSKTFLVSLLNFLVFLV